MLGDIRWGGSWGIQADFVAKTPCSIMCIDVVEIMVTTQSAFQYFFAMSDDFRRQFVVWVFRV